MVCLHIYLLFFLSLFLENKAGKLWLLTIIGSSPFSEEMLSPCREAPRPQLLSQSAKILSFIDSCLPSWSSVASKSVSVSGAWYIVCDCSGDWCIGDVGLYDKTGCSTSPIAIFATEITLFSSFRGCAGKVRVLSMRLPISIVSAKIGFVVVPPLRAFVDALPVRERVRGKCDGLFPKLTTLTSCNTAGRLLVWPVCARFICGV